MKKTIIYIGSNEKMSDVQVAPNLQEITAAVVNTSL